MAQILFLITNHMDYPGRLGAATDEEWNGFWNRYATEDIRRVRQSQFFYSLITRRLKNDRIKCIGMSNNDGTSSTTDDKNGLIFNYVFDINAFINGIHDFNKEVKEKDKILFVLNGKERNTVFEILVKLTSLLKQHIQKVAVHNPPIEKCRLNEYSSTCSLDWESMCELRYNRLKFAGIDHLQSREDSFDILWIKFATVFLESGQKKAANGQKKKSNTSPKQYLEGLQKQGQNDQIERKIIGISKLKHKIAHLFLYLDIDIQGLEELRGDKSKSDDYIIDIFRDRKKRPHTYINSYAKLKKMVKGNVSPPKGKVAREKDVWDIIKESRLDSDPKAIQFLRLCGLRAGDGNCSIEHYLNGLDVFADAQDVSGFRKALLGKKIALERKKLTFHEWYDMLIETLDDLRERIAEI